MNTDTIQLPPSILNFHQRKRYGPRSCSSYEKGATITAEVRHDDSCKNGHNTFAITGTILDREGQDVAGGCLHEEIAKYFPELAPLIKWHLTSTDGPMHYAESVVYLAGERDHWGLLKGEFRQHTSRGKIQNGGVEGVPCWELDRPEAREVYANEKPAHVTLEWRAHGITGEGKTRELDAARSCAVWPDATDKQLSAPAHELRAALAARLPALMQEFKVAVESLGFTY